MARSQVNAHKKNILNEAKIPLQEIQSGTIVRFNYRGKDVHDPTPLVLVLNEN